MRVSLAVPLFSFMMLFSSFSPLSASSSSCELQAQFNLNRIYKAGDFILGGLFDIHSLSVVTELSFTAKQKDPTCYG